MWIIYLAGSFLCMMAFAHTVTLFTKPSRKFYGNGKGKVPELSGKERFSSMVKDWVIGLNLIQALTQFIGHEDVQPVEIPERK